MTDPARDLVRDVADTPHLAAAAEQLCIWLLREGGGNETALSESRARALLRVTGAVDDLTLADFARLTENASARRVALYDLLSDSGLAADSAAEQCIAGSRGKDAATEPAIPWLMLALLAYAWKRDYPAAELDPASPPIAHSPADRVVRDAGYFLRRQVQRAPTERERLARRLAFRGPRAARASAPSDTPMVPDPAIFRPPVPVRYSELSGEPLAVEVEASGVDSADEAQPVTRGEPLVITEEDVAEAAPERVRIETSPPAPLPRSGVVMPGNDSSARPGLTIRNRRGRAAGATTKLRVVVQEYADGPGMYGVQVLVRSRSANVKVAGATNKDGHFLCQLPVHVDEGLTYQVEVSWPRDHGDAVERKAITLNADRTEFLLPFYPRYAPPETD
jgi:hypothetical protein